MRSADDVKRDPKPGDVLIYGPQWQRVRADVTNNDGNDVEYLIEGRLTYCTTKQWRNWMLDAEVLHVAE